MDWPIPNTEHKTLFLNGNKRLSEQQSNEGAKLSYQSDVPAQQIDADAEELCFEYTFTKTSYIIGYSRAVLYMSCNDLDDLDVFVQLRKADSNGRILQNINIPLADLGLKAEEVETVNSLKYLGPTGILRASHRETDRQRSKAYWPFHTHAKEEFVPPGEIVRLDIGLWPTGIRFETGEKLVLKVAGHNMTLAEFPPLRGQFQCRNRGVHNLFVGSEYDSSITIPMLAV